MKVVITGSLGHIGKPLAAGLVKKGHSVTVISSKPDRVKEIEATGASAAVGSVEDIVFLASAFADADAVYLMIPPDFSQPDQLEYYERLAKTYAKAVEQSGVKRIVYLSSYGAHLDKGTGFILGSNHGEIILNKLTGVAITYMRPGYFYYNLYAQTDMIKHRGIMGANYGGEDRLLLVAPADIAAAILEELEKPAEQRKIVYVASDDRSVTEIAKVIGAAIGKPDLSWIMFANDDFQKSLVSHGVPQHAAENLVELGTAIHTGVLRTDYDKHKPPMGKVKLEEFATEFALAFK